MNNKVTFNSGLAESYASREAFKALRTNVMFSGAEIKVIVITSADAGDGKSTVSAELAKSFAESGKRTLLIDADMRKSVMLKRNNKTNEISGLSEVLSGQSSKDDVIFSTQDENFDVMFTGHFPPNPVELLGNDRLKSLFAELKGIYDYVIVDSPPLGLVIDAAVIAAAADAAIMVLSSGKTRRKEAAEVLNQLKKSGTKILGAILNDAQKPYGKYYGKSYKTEYYK